MGSKRLSLPPEEAYLHPYSYLPQPPSSLPVAHTEPRCLHHDKNLESIIPLWFVSSYIHGISSTPYVAYPDPRWIATQRLNRRADNGKTTWHDTTYPTGSSWKGMPLLWRKDLSTCSSGVRAFQYLIPVHSLPSMRPSEKFGFGLQEHPVDLN